MRYRYAHVAAYYWYMALHAPVDGWNHKPSIHYYARYIVYKEMSNDKRKA